ncbi:ATPase [Corynebacterium mustelae]|uniref:ATPase n=1 Tax=Corynebacterium mustelae TaxID=571915 RepID=A0A0G3GZD4_9CORY|nr:ATP-binding protein [Corynebacterium mustelae]AKK04918.1 ATPase [Corynebacterium mustelae]
MKNPFRPSFGLNPHILAGRAGLLRSFSLAFAEGIGAPLRASLLSGPRGTGKTVMLNHIEALAQEQGWIVLRAFPRNEMIANLIDPTIANALAALDTANKPATRRITGISAGGVSLNTEVVASPQPRKTLNTQLRALADMAAKHGAGILITLDEVQSAQVEELAELATAIQDLIRDEYDIAFAAAGLPEGIHVLLDHPGTTFLRRAEHIQLGKLSSDDVKTSFTETITAAGREVTEEASEEATKIIRGYPYLLQVVGSLSWAAASLEGSTTVELSHVVSIAADAQSRMETHVHQPALRSVTDSQRDFLHAMAEVADGETAHIKDIAQHFGVTSSALSTRRHALLESGIITAPKRGELEFSLPYLKEYLLRTS